MERDDEISAERLFAAADALLSAIDSSAGMNALVDVIAGETGSARQPGAFTTAEFSEAMSFLVRLGVVTGTVWIVSPTDPQGGS